MKLFLVLLVLTASNFTYAGKTARAKVQMRVLESIETKELKSKVLVEENRSQLGSRYFQLNESKSEKKLELIF